MNLPRQKLFKGVRLNSHVVIKEIKRRSIGTSSTAYHEKRSLEKEILSAKDGINGDVDIPFFSNRKCVVKGTKDRFARTPPFWSAF